MSTSTVTVPWVPSRDEVIKAILSIVKPSRKDVVFDIGCGDGRVATTLASTYGVRTICIELREDLARKAQKLARERRVEHLLEIVVGDMYTFSFSRATIVYMYLLTSANYLLRPKLDKELQPGTIVISLDFPVPGWRPLKVIELPQSWQRTLYVYVKGYSEVSIDVPLSKLRELVGGRLKEELLKGIMGGHVKLSSL
ncbi:MAG TPA: class I SAM-dependent methyltransferase [Pyrodictiaceae archaeon]|nr:class I SAM-dependent methyltransferase [Pyrodictiaceae archaeon]HIP85590.1 class I SAM-dependent methyltransferase [Pyrodictium sp.]HIQ55243.1 class I SAM-dependent methyltransferase [Pyrodictium sp.]